MLSNKPMEYGFADIDILKRHTKILFTFISGAFHNAMRIVVLLIVQQNGYKENWTLLCTTA